MPFLNPRRPAAGPCNCPMPAPIPVDTAHLPLSGQFFSLSLGLSDAETYRGPSEKARSRRSHNSGREWVRCLGPPLPPRVAQFFTYKVGRKLNVRYVLEGSVQRASQSATQAAKASCDPNYNVSDAPRGDPQQSERDQHEAPPCRPKYPVVCQHAVANQF